jgi:uncharacterized low-complexity protein
MIVLGFPSRIVTRRKVSAPAPVYSGERQKTPINPNPNRRNQMSKRTTLMTVALGSAFAATAALAPVAHAAGNPFAASQLSSGYQLAQADKKQDGSCGGDKKKDANCGADKKAAGDKKKDGKCGEAKCGADKDKKK